MLSINELRPKRKIIWHDQPFEVLWVQHSKVGRAGAVMRTKLKNLIDGSVLEETFKGGDKLAEADLNVTKAQFMYNDSDNYHFMDQESYEQFGLSKKQLGKNADYLVPETNVDILNFNDKPINVELPIKVDIEVKKAPPGVKGDTATGATKTVTLATGATMDVPLFIKEGDVIRIDTRDGKYVERAK